MAGEDRTEAATPKKRNELRRRGQVARSTDLTSIIVFLGVLMTMHAVGGASAHRIQQFMTTSFAHLGETALTPHVLMAKAFQMGLLLAQTIGPLLGAAMALGIVANIAQTGFLVSTQALVPDFNRLNPLTGFTRFMSAKGMVETVKAMGKLGIIAYIAHTTISGSYPQLLDTIRKDLPTNIGFIGELLYRLALRIGMFLFVLSAADYGWQRWSFERSIRMTKEEVKQETKQTEGNPMIKSRIRARQRQLARRRMMDAVPKATVVITNPTHFAVALRYEAGQMGAPQVVAKGADLLAAKIREVAREHDVPIIENPPLARALYKQVEVGREIPGDLYAAVAEILAFVYQINARRNRVGA